ncbi:MAG: 3-phenylpropionate/trans-cinnamate dioxygenase ferredoxin reductase component [Solirubrobacteraceae bacterium]|jgi:3-phenylpropionate/trans-cinnamate dioxygenase ferredoxin reductase subunit|nr:3-phenylpropionate/trans-cinnamate dioxygenase ferredoxin reductase component [Solirubrobacteraceae bacterium]
MTDRHVHLIVGGGLAGAKAAETLRAEGFGGRVVLIADEPELPYERPPLSKDYLRGEHPREHAQVHDAAFYSDHDIELLTGVAATALDLARHRVELADGRSLGYDQVLLATGSVPHRPPIPGAGLDGVHILRTVADADRLREALRRGGPLVLVGAGWIGCEVAASARQMGVETTLVDVAGEPLEHVLGSQIGGWFAALHRAHGVHVRMGAGVARFDGDKFLEAVVLADGTRIEARTALLAVGIAPDVALARAAGLAVDDGILVDDRLRSSDPDVFAAGDVARAWHPRYGRRIRVEHWSAALNQGPAAARSMLGQDRPYDRVPYFFSDQYDAGMEYVGLHRREDRLVLRGSLDDQRFQAIWLAPAGHVTAGMHVNDWNAIGPLEELIERGGAVDPVALADPSTPIAECSAAA